MSCRCFHLPMLLVGCLALPGLTCPALVAADTGQLTVRVRDRSFHLSIRARQGNGDAAFVGLAIPLGTTKRALTLSSAWPTMPVSWPDRSYGIGPLKICNRLGRKGQPVADYRKLHLAMNVGGRKFDLLPARDGSGCPDAADAMYTEHYLDQVLNEESKLVPPKR